MRHDVRHAVRVLLKSPGFSITAIVTLALGIGLNTAVFGIVNLLLFRPPDVQDPDRLIWIASYPRGPEGPRQHLAFSDVEALRAQDAFDRVVAYAQLPISIGNGGLAVRVQGQIVSGDLFGALGVHPALGAGLPAEGGSAPVAGVVLSDALWKRLFNGRPSAVGAAVVVNGHPFTVTGVMPPRFTGADPFERADLWVSISSRAEVMPQLPTALESGTFWLNAFARLAPGRSVAEASAIARTLADRAERQYPHSHKDFGLRAGTFAGVGPRAGDEVVPISALLLGATTLVLLIACANVANLLLARGVRRDSELRVRMALGGTRARIVRQLLVESGLLALAGAAAGLLVAMWGIDLLLRFAEVPVPLDTAPDFRVLTFTGLTTIATMFLFGLLPALRASGGSIFPTLREYVAPGPRQSRLQRGLVIAQLVLSLVLLSGTGMLLHSLGAARHVDVGFATAGRFSIDYDLQLQGYSNGRAEAFNRSLLEQVRAIPGVKSATIAQVVPAGGTVFAAPVQIDGHGGGDHALAAFNRVWPGYFRTMEISLLAGRGFTETDATAGVPVAIINEQLAARYLPGVGALGRTLKLGIPDDPPREIIGIVRNVMIDSYNEAPWPAVYLPHSGTAEAASLIVETDPSGDVMAGVARGVSRSFSALDVNLPTGGPITFDQHLAGRLDKERALARVLAVAGTLALLLAALGLYGLMAHAVHGRRREIGVRVALGASRAEVISMFIRQSGRLVAWGLIVALPIMVLLSAAVAGSLVGVRTGDPLSIAAAAAVLIVTMFAATWIPARRALAIDPAVVLKTE